LLGGDCIEILKTFSQVGQGEHGHDLVAVHLVALRVDGQAAVGVAVVRDAQVGAEFGDRGPD